MKSVKFLTSGDKQHGLGHVTRSWVLAQELASRGIRVGFETPADTVGYSYIEQRISVQGVTTLNDGSEFSNIIVDLENGPTRKLLQECRKRYSKVIVIGGVGFPMHDQSAIDELVDLQIYQSIVVTNEFSAKNCISGCEYIILDKEYRDTLAFNYSLRRDAVVCMGGADPHSLTRSVCDNLIQSFNGYRPKVRAVFGAAADVVELPSEVNAIHAPSTLANLFRSSKFGVTALGMTTYEAACLGLPTASISWSKDHEITAKVLEEKGVTVNLGLWDKPDWGKLGTFVDKMHNEGAWRKMSEAGMELVDGHGVGRVADRIMEIV